MTLTITEHPDGTRLQTPTNIMELNQEETAQLREYFLGEKAATELKIGTVLVARKDLVMTITKEIALIKGGEYVIKDITGLCFSVESLVDKCHFFDVEDYEKYFYINPPKAMTKTKEYLYQYHNNNPKDWLFEKKEVVEKLLQEYADQQTVALQSRIEELETRNLEKELEANANYALQVKFKEKAEFHLKNTVSLLDRMAEAFPNRAVLEGLVKTIKALKSDDEPVKDIIEYIEGKIVQINSALTEYQEYKNSKG